MNAARKRTSACIGLLACIVVGLSVVASRRPESGTGATLSTSAEPEVGAVLHEAPTPLAERLREPVLREPDLDISDSGGLGETLDVHGLVVDSHGRPVREADVACDSPFVMLKTDDEGRFELDVSRETPSFKVVASHPLHGRQLGEWRFGPRDVELCVQLAFEAGAEVNLCVVGDDLVPLEGAEVRLWRSEGTTQGALLAGRDRLREIGAAASLQGRQWAHVASTDRSGCVAIGGLEGGAYRVHVQLAGWVPELLQEVVVEPLSVSRLDLVQLESGVVLSGRVESASGSGMADATVRGFFSHVYYETTTDSFGAFTLGAFPREPGSGELVIDGPDGETFSNPGFVLGQGAGEQTFLCREPYHVEIRGRDRSLLEGTLTVRVDCANREVGGAILGPEFGEYRVVELIDGVCALEYLPEYTEYLEFELPGFAIETLAMDDLRQSGTVALSMRAL